MSFTANCGWALARAMGTGAVCLLIGLTVRALLVHCGKRMRLLAWGALLVPYFTPPLLVGYAYSDFSLSLVRHPVYNEIWYCLLTWMRFAPIAAVVLYLAPSSVSQEAVYCRRLVLQREAGARSRLSYLSFLVRGPLRAWGAAFALVFLLAFAEFEVASLCGIRTWTVSLFDAHAGGLALSESLRLSVLPVLFETALLLLMLLILWGSRRTGAAAVHRRTALGNVAATFIWAYLAVAVLAVTVLPAVIVFRGTVAGLRTLAQHFVLGKDIAASLLFAGASAMLAHQAAGWFSRRTLSARHSRPYILLAFCLCIPGMLGPLVLALSVVFIFQGLGLRAIYDTPIPLVLALLLVLLPFAVLLRLLLQALRPAHSLHAADLLRASACQRLRRWRSRLLWQLETRGHFWVAFLLFCWGYFDLTASSILAPPGMTPVSVRLYNLMHYGQSAVLSAMVCVAFAAPVAVVLLAGGVRGLLSRLSIHG